MNRHVNAIAGRLSLRHPQRRSLEILDRITEIVPPRKNADADEALRVIQTEFPSVTDFERDFPSLCFALATGVGKTRLMGAFISYLHLAHGINNFFVLAPNLTIYRKLITDFTPNTPKYVFRGIAEFATAPPEVITGDDYENRASTLFDQLVRCRVNIFNISKINTEVRGGHAPRIKRLSEYIGESYFEYLAALPDLVLLMDESHRYRASAGVKAINELQPVLGLELTATPFAGQGRSLTRFKNVIFDYPLGTAMADGFVKEPAVVTRRDFRAAGMTDAEVERLKLEDGVRLHESVKVELETYAREAGRPIVKPFLLAIARDTEHAAELKVLVESDAFFEGRYRDKVIQVDSSQTGAAEEQMIERLLKVERNEEPTEIVIHVNMLKEGWDVTNLYTIVPLRRAEARVLIEQSIGRGLRLPYGARTGVSAVDRLNIIAHDRFQEIIDEASRPDSTIRMQSIVLDDRDLRQRTVTVVSQSVLASQLGMVPEQATGTTLNGGRDVPPLFADAEERKVAQLTYQVVERMSQVVSNLPSTTYLNRPDVRAAIIEQVTEQYRPVQQELEGIVTPPPDISAVVVAATQAIVQGTIDIPRIVVVPAGEVSSRFEPFQLSLESLRFQKVAEELWIRHLRTAQVEVVALQKGGVEEPRPEDYVVSGLVDFDDVSYDDHADLLYDLASQVVRHFRTYLSDEDTTKVLRYHQREIARFVHAQMQAHHREEATRYEVKVNRGVQELKASAYTGIGDEPVRDFRVTVPDPANIAKYLFGGFSKSLYPVEKFHSDTERRLAIILEREAKRWFRPRKGQFQIFYKRGGDQLEYQPDFVAEIDDAILMLEPKRLSDVDDEDVVAKKAAAEEWCRHATEWTRQHDGKPWRYVLIPHDRIAENMTLPGLLAR